MASISVAQLLEQHGQGQTVVQPRPHQRGTAEAAAGTRTTTSGASQKSVDGRIVQRRGSMAQGHALETLGHAVEYLVDSRMFMEDAGDPTSQREAVQILMRMSRTVFSECPEVQPGRRRMVRWLTSKVAPRGQRVTG